MSQKVKVVNFVDFVRLSQFELASVSAFPRSSKQINSL